MADDFQAMLNTIGEKFDMSFDETEEHCSETLKEDHQKSINPENRPEISSHIETHQPQSDKQSHPSHQQVHAKDMLERKSGESEKQGVDVPFLPLLERDEEEEGKEGEGETGMHFSCEEQEMQYYRSLSEKFQDALNKAHSRKSISTCYQGEFMERQQHYQRKKQSGLQQLQIEKEKRESRYYRGKPLINSYSQQILPHYTPIDKRYPAVLAQKKRKVEAWVAEQRRAAEAAEEQEVRQMQRWSEIVKERVGQVRSSEEYYENQQRWNQRRFKNIEESAKKQDESIRAEISFKPKINQRSDHMMKKKTERIPIYEKEPELKKFVSDPNCTFKPNLSKTLKRIP